MEFFTYLAAFLIVNRIRKSLKLSPLMPKWRISINIAWWSIIAIGIFALAGFDHIEWAQYLVGTFILYLVVTFTIKEDDFIALKPYFEAHYPLIIATGIIGVFLLIFPDFSEEHKAYFIPISSCSIGGAFIWTLAKFAGAKKQLEELKLVNQQNQLLDRLVTERTAELTKQKNELQQTIQLLQTTQQQLVQSEKLASLGELTAGIAHEIQNPLKFVNNFSEVSIELMNEMEEELQKGDTEEAIAIANDIKQNLEKIIHHGKRADGIVKGMLQHSRASNGMKEPTDINKLADEYLRLAYHGLRAKDKTFNTELITHFAENLPKATIVPQDIGRVLLNLFTNAFYAVHQKQKEGIADYKPTLTLSTNLSNDKIVIKVQDNGKGIPEHIKDKIMQPFFTTKPTGEGTGLGLSLSYDIVVKGHGGTIEIDSKEGEFTEFTIYLPL
jgi:signal transduction histidine kinase